MNVVVVVVVVVIGGRQAGIADPPSMPAALILPTYIQRARGAHKVTCLRGQQPARSGVKDIYIHTYAHHFPPTNQSTNQPLRTTGEDPFLQDRGWGPDHASTATIVYSIPFHSTPRKCTVLSSTCSSSDR